MTGDHHPEDAGELKHEGLYVQRFEYPCSQSDRERALHDAWVRENHQSHVLCWLLNGKVTKNAIGVDQQLIDRYPTQDEATLAATVVQWLGTSCGFDFLERALRDAGYRITRDKRAL